ncbi:MAG: hypothetical protein RLZZ490_1502 [Cyanobacteriota bacterium]
MFSHQTIINCMGCYHTSLTVLVANQPHLDGMGVVVSGKKGTTEKLKYLKTMGQGQIENRRGIMGRSTRPYQ